VDIKIIGGCFAPKIFFILILCVSFSILNCGKTNNPDRIGPKPPSMIPETSDTSSIERGIDAVPEGDWIQVEWTHPDKESIRCYDIYRSNATDSLFRFIAETTDTIFIDKIDSIGIRYLYFVKAVNHDGIKSDPSDTVGYLLNAKPIDLSPTGVIGNTKPLFNWHDPNEPPKASYIIRVVQPQTGGTVWISEVASNYEYTQSIAYNHDGIAKESILISGMDYLWRVDIRGSEFSSGSESPWMPLHIK
jgi:hypothetical protein